MTQLSEPQRTLLAEVKESPIGGLWISQYGFFHRTAQALVRRGLVEVTDRAFGHSQYFISPSRQETPHD